MFSLRILNNFNFIPFKYIYKDIYNDIYNDAYSEDIYKDTFLIRIYIIVMNFFLTTLAKVITTLINISYLILFEILFSKINIKKIVNSSRIIFSNVFI